MREAPEGTALPSQHITQATQLKALLYCIQSIQLVMRALCRPFVTLVRQTGRAGKQEWGLASRTFSNAGYEFGASDADVANIIDANLVRWHV